MANIGVRSPYFIYKEQAGAVSAKVEVTIDSVLRYTIIKNTGTSVRLDISELVRDYVNPTYAGTLTDELAGEMPVTVDVKFYDADNATGTQVGTTQSESHVAYDAYGYFSEGYTGGNYGFTFGDRVLLSETTIWMPENESGSFYQTVAGNLTIISFNATAEQLGSITIKRQPCDKYDPVEVIFINKFGVPQEIYFFAKRTDSLNTSGESYQSGAINANGSYSITSHQIVDFDRNGKRSYNLSTGYVSEAFNSYMQELLLSEQVWLKIDSSVIPVQVKSPNVTYKTSLNDKLVAYTVDFEEANDLITTVR
jgi:hypothetical protein